MRLLRIIQQPGSAAGKHRIAVEAQVPNLQTLSFAREIEFSLTAEDDERIRWYLEDYLQFVHDPAPKLAAGVEALMRERGEELFRALFEGQPNATRLWAAVEPHLSATRIEIATGVAEATVIPWELMRNPDTGVRLALSATSFVRAQPGGQTTLAPAAAEKVRILLVISRPSAGEDVPFRSVAGRLITELSEQDRGSFQLDVLRPPTFEQLAKELKLAKERDEPYHVVHFDGHGVYADPKDLDASEIAFSTVKLKGEIAGPCGFLVFEDPDAKTRARLVDGFKLGETLRDAGVPILILNACQSAFAEASATPQSDATPREEIAAYGSLAQAIIEHGAAGVVAMRYSVYVVTAAQFVAELYAALARGRSLGEAASFARGSLADQPMRRLAYDARPLQDWMVPIVWERTALRLWAAQSDDAPLTIRLDSGGATAGVLDPQLPARPDVGFFGRDETLYALDRAFDTHKIVLLHAFAGSGKTATAAEFARWYALTGGLEGPVLFSSFERHLPLARVLDKIGLAFGRELERLGVHWGALNDDERRSAALQILNKRPVLWIWDNIEPVNGFPARTPSDWSANEQRELRDFLLAARETKAKFLLTSRRDERGWLGETPRRIMPPPMPMLERLQLAGGIAEHRGKRLVNLPDLRPLLAYTQGNPLTILVVVGEVLRAGVDTPDRLTAFVEALRRGEANLQDEAAEGRSGSLAASLGYGFEAAFDESERRILALLHLFHGFVNVGALRLMGAPEADWAFDEVRGLTREEGIALLDRAGEIGLLTPLGGGHYHVHPALPWYFHDLFGRYFDADRGERAQRAFVEAMGGLANFYAHRAAEGDNSVVHALAAEEDNLVAAWRSARDRGWWAQVLSAMQGLRQLYDATGRTPAWRRLVETMTPDFVDPSDDGPQPGREGEWNIFTEYCVRLARQARELPRAERLQRKRVEWNRNRAGEALATPPEYRDAKQKNDIRNLAASLHELGEIQRESGDSECVASYRESFELAGSIGDRPGQAVCAFNLGIAYMDIDSICDFDRAEHWLSQSFDLRAAGDDRGRAISTGQLGYISLRRFDQAVEQKQPDETCVGFLRDAERRYEEALDLLPSTAIVDRGVFHNALGLIYHRAGEIDLAAQRYQQSIHCCVQSGDAYRAAQTRLNVALMFLHAGRFPDARAYAEAALANFSEYGDRAAVKIEKAQRLLADIARAEAEHRKPE
ncbi:MAG: CHAT domain-containing protein [Hyphomicrobiales bacterium]|nr:CHAT domain-containing protein [Hyphomicrobiales bacterium]